jgi:ribose transport system substrate-binding protein
MTKEKIMHKLITRLMICSISIVLILSGCGDSEKNSKAGAGDQSAAVIGVSLLTRTHPFYQDLEAGLLEEAKKNNYSLLINSGEFDVSRQKDQFADFIVKKVDVIIVSPCDSKSIGTSVTEANKAGIPVFTVDIACLAEGVKIVSHIASDNVAGGREAAKAVVEAIGGSGKVAIIDHPEVESVIQRVKGFEDEIALHKGIKIASKLSGKGMKSEAFKVAEDVIQAHPDLSAFFGINDDSSLGALAAVEKAGKAGKIVIIGFDAVPEARKAIREGKLYADVIQNPRLIGKTAIQTIAKYLGGEPVPSKILIPCGLFRKADAEKQPE